MRNLAKLLALFWGFIGLLNVVWFPHWGKPEYSGMVMALLVFNVVLFFFPAGCIYLLAGNNKTERTDK